MWIFSDNKWAWKYTNQLVNHNLILCYRKCYTIQSKQQIYSVNRKWEKDLRKVLTVECFESDTKFSALTSLRVTQLVTQLYPDNAPPRPDTTRPTIPHLELALPHPQVRILPLAIIVQTLVHVIQADKLYDPRISSCNKVLLCNKFSLLQGFR